MGKQIEVSSQSQSVNASLDFLIRQVSLDSPPTKSRLVPTSYKYLVRINLISPTNHPFLPSTLTISKSAFDPQCFQTCCYLCEAPPPTTRAGRVCFWGRAQFKNPGFCWV